MSEVEEQLSINQLKFMAALPMISAPLSLIGSSLIVNIILKDWKRKLSGAYHRILLMFSIYDIISSFAMALSTLPSPVGTPGVWGAIGNTGTCTAQGFFLQTGAAVLYITMLLMLYYVLTVRYNMSEINFRKRIELYAHIIIISLSLVPSIIGATFGWFNNIGNICFIGSYPKGCNINSEVECERGENAFEILWLITGFFAAISFAFLPLSLIILTWTFWKQEKEMEQKYRFQLDIKLDNATPDNISCQNDDVIERKKRPQSRNEKWSKKQRKVRNQAICYAGASFLCLSWALLSRTYKGPPPFILRCCAQFFFPMQGFFNFVNYSRPRITRLRKHNLAQSWLHAVYLIVFVSEYKLKKRKLQKQARKACQDRLRSIRDEAN